MQTNLSDALGVGDSHGDFAPEFEGLRDKVAKLLTKLASEFKGGRHWEESLKSGFLLQHLAMSTQFEAHATVLVRGDISLEVTGDRLVGNLVL